MLSTAELLVYRKDKFDELCLSPPRTIAETLEAARRLHDPSQGFYGMAWNGGRGTALSPGLWRS